VICNFWIGGHTEDMSFWYCKILYCKIFVKCNLSSEKNMVTFKVKTSNWIFKFRWLDKKPCWNKNMNQISFLFSGSISNIGDDTEYKCKDGTSPEVRHKVISGVVGAASSVTSIQVANLLRLFKIPQVKNNNLSSLWKLNWVEVRTSKSCY